MLETTNVKLGDKLIYQLKNIFYICADNHIHQKGMIEKEKDGENKSQGFC